MHTWKVVCGNWMCRTNVRLVGGLLQRAGLHLWRTLQCLLSKLYWMQRQGIRITRRMPRARRRRKRKSGLKMSKASSLIQPSWTSTSQQHPSDVSLYLPPPPPHLPLLIQVSWICHLTWCLLPCTQPIPYLPLLLTRLHPCMLSSHPTSHGTLDIPGMLLMITKCFRSLINGQLVTLGLWKIRWKVAGQQGSRKGEGIQVWVAKTCEVDGWYERQDPQPLRWSHWAPRLTRWTRLGDGKNGNSTQQSFCGT